jgi:hypothetical protein
MEKLIVREVWSCCRLTPLLFLLMFTCCLPALCITVFTLGWLYLQERAVIQIIQVIHGMRVEAHPQWNHSVLWAVEECHLEILGALLPIERPTTAKAGGPRTGEWLWVYPRHYKHCSTFFIVDSHCRHCLYLPSKNLFSTGKCSVLGSSSLQSPFLFLYQEKGETQTQDTVCSVNEGSDSLSTLLMIKLLLYCHLWGTQSIQQQSCPHVSLRSLLASAEGHRPLRMKYVSKKWLLELSNIMQLSPHYKGSVLSSMTDVCHNWVKGTL